MPARGIFETEQVLCGESATLQRAECPVQDIDDILRNRTEKRQLGNGKGNTFSTATFAIEEEPQVPSTFPPCHPHATHPLICEVLKQTSLHRHSP